MILSGFYYMAAEYLECPICKKKLSSWNQDLLDQLDVGHRLQFPCILTRLMACDLEDAQTAGNWEQCGQTPAEPCWAARRGKPQEDGALPERLPEFQHRPEERTGHGDCLNPPSTPPGSRPASGWPPSTVKTCCLDWRKSRLPSPQSTDVPKFLGKGSRIPRLANKKCERRRSCFLQTVYEKYKDWPRWKKWSYESNMFHQQLIKASNNHRMSQYQYKISRQLQVMKVRHIII